MAQGDYRDIEYHVADGIAKITINRPEVRNAFRPQTLFELRQAFDLARDDDSIGVIILTGKGDLAFCSGGDQRIRGDDGYIGDDDVGAKGIGRLNVLDLQVQIRRTPKPVVAMIAGYAVGGGHVLHVMCDLSIAAENARFQQTGPKVGLVRRRLRIRTASCSDWAEARSRDLVSVSAVRRDYRAPVGPRERRRAASDLEIETVQWCREMLEHSPLALRMLKASMNAADDGLAGVQQLAGDATLLFYMTEEAQEGRDAYKEKRKPDFGQFPKRP